MNKKKKKHFFNYKIINFLNDIKIKNTIFHFFILYIYSILNSINNDTEKH